jgi:hypothetical protein
VAQFEHGGIARKASGLSELLLKRVGYVLNEIII